MKKVVQALLPLIAAGLLATMPVGCTKGQDEGGKAPTGGKEKAREAGKVEIPAPQPIEDASVLGRLQLRDPNELVNKVASWAAMVQPSITSESLRQQLAGGGVTLQDLKPGQSASAFVLAPPTDAQQPSAALLAPASTSSQLVQTLSQARGSNDVTTAGQYAMIAQGMAPGTAEPTGRKLAPLAAAKPASDLQLYLNTSATMAMYGPRLQALSGALPGFVALAMSQQPGGARGMQMQILPILQAEITALLDFLGQSQYVSLGADLGQQMFELSAIAKGKPGTTLEKVLKAKPVSAPDLAGYLDPGSIVRGQQTIHDLKGFTDIYFKYIEIAMGQGRQAEMAKLREDLKDIGKVGMLTNATSFKMTPEGKIVYEIVATSDDNKAFMDLLRTKLVGLLNTGLIHDFYKGLGIEPQVKEDAQTRKVAGAEVHRFTLTLTPGPALAAREREQLEKMFGKEMVIEMAMVDDRVVMTAGEPIDTLAARVAAGTQGPSLQAMKTWPAGGILYFDVNVAAFLRQIKSTMPPEQAGRVPDLEPGAPQLIMAAYHTDGLAWYRLGIPKGLLGSLKPSQE